MRCRRPGSVSARQGSGIRFAPAAVKTQSGSRAPRLPRAQSGANSERDRARVRFLGGRKLSDRHGLRSPASISSNADLYRRRATVVAFLLASLVGMSVLFAR